MGPYTKFILSLVETTIPPSNTNEGLAWDPLIKNVITLVVTIESWVGVLDLKNRQPAQVLETSDLLVWGELGFSNLKVKVVGPEFQARSDTNLCYQITSVLKGVWDVFCVLWQVEAPGTCTNICCKLPWHTLEWFRTWECFLWQTGFFTKVWFHHFVKALKVRPLCISSHISIL